MVARYEDAFAFSDMNLLIAIVENHLTRIDVIDGIFAGAMYAAAEVITLAADLYEPKNIERKSLPLPLAALSWL